MDETGATRGALPQWQRNEWRADAIKRGGVPVDSDADPHARYLANRIVWLIDALEASERAVARLSAEAHAMTARTIPLAATAAPAPPESEGES